MWRESEKFYKIFWKVNKALKKTELDVKVEKKKERKKWEIGCNGARLVGGGHVGRRGCLWIHGLLWASIIVGCKPAKYWGKGKKRGERGEADCKLTTSLDKKPKKTL